MDGCHVLAAALVVASLLQASPASATESVPEKAVVVTKSTFKGIWPLPYERATLTCRPRGYANTMATLEGEFALNDAAKAEGFPALKTLRLKGRQAPASKTGLDELAKAADEFCSRSWSRS
ncbi:hypothetical protein [Lysobacter sp. CA196]|uniref:hypothetical protein n=1 Tax=Lysobacter sp. CA196 TaxID=3455606 RepID=UPI003F8D6E95